MRSEVDNVRTASDTPFVCQVAFFEARIAQSGDCWLWTGAVNVSTKGGGHYGRAGLWHDGRVAETWYAHRLSWVIHHGEIPPGHTIDHLCRNTLCVNPAHLEPVPSAVNVGRAAAAARAARPLCKKGHDDWVQRPIGRYCAECNRIRVRENKRRAR